MSQRDLFLNPVSHIPLNYCPEDSHVSRSVVPGSERAKMILVTSGKKCLELLKQQNHIGLLEKMLLESSNWLSMKSVLTWKVVATPGGRSVYRLSMPISILMGNECLLWPRPTVAGLRGGSHTPAKMKKLLDANIITQEEYKVLISSNGNRINPDLLEWLMGYPIGWTELDASEMQLSRSKSIRSSKRLQILKKEI